MSSRTSANDSTSSSTFRVNYSDYVADITGSPKSTRKVATTGIGHHINPLQKPNPSRQNQQIQQQQQTGGMPQYGGGAEKCARCSKSVYLAEKKVGAGRSFHSSCFSCYTCKRKLDASALSEHKGEIYCKSCYTRQFGAHGLISGVTMSTEQTGTHEIRTSRRSSYGSDLDAPVMTYQQTRQRANSSENVFRDDYGTTKNDELSQKYPRGNDISSPNKQNTGVDSKYQRPSSPTGFQIPIETSTNNNRPRPSYAEDDDRKKYTYEGEKLSYGSGTSAMVNIPVVVQPKRLDPTIDRMEMPINPTQDHHRSRSPSVTSSDSYQRQSSRERQTNLTDDYSRFNINEDNSNKNIRRYSDDNTINTIASENPVSTRNYHQSSSASYETKYRSSTSNANNYEREQYHSRDSSPSAPVNRNQSPLPTSGYTSPSASTYRAGPSRDSTSSSSAYVPQHDYYNTQTSNSSDHRRSSSPHNNNRTSTGLNDFVAKTNLAGNTSSSAGNQFSTLGALINNPRRQDDDDFDN